MLSVDKFQADVAKATAFASAFTSMAQAAPSIIQSVAEGASPDIQAKATHAADVLHAMLTFAGHEIAVIEGVWPKLKPLLSIALDLTGNAGLAAIVNSIPTAPPAAA